MKNYLKHTVLSFMIIGLGHTLCAQDGKTKKAEQKYNQFDYVKAIEYYEALAEDGTVDAEVLKNLGNSHYLKANYEDAAKWYKELVAKGEKDLDPNYYYRYAQSLKSLQKYAESDKLMEKFITESEDDGRATKYASKKDYLKQIELNSGKFEVALAPFNTEKSDFAPSFYNDGVVFSSARDSSYAIKNIHNWNNASFLNLYQATTKDDSNFDVTKLSRKMNTKAHESSTVFTKDGKTMYFTRNNFKKGFTRGEDGVSRLKIYRANLVNGDWSNIEELPFNDDNYSVAHPALNSKEDKLYFASDMSGTLGESDIFYVDILPEGGFGTPQNLGAEINTEERETFPFITANDMLYFSSDGHPGLGGLDVFAVKLKAGKLSDFINLGTPLNTDEDDFSFILDEENKKGFFASNRPNGVGDDDIYMFTLTEPLNFTCSQFLAGIVKDKESGAILANADVQVLDVAGKVLGKTVSDEKGEFEITLDCNTNELTAIGIKADYREEQKNFTLTKDDTRIELLLEPGKMIVEKGDDLAKYLDLPIIYFDYDKSNIRSDAQNQLAKVLAYMQQYPKVKLDIRSHTDSRDNDTYNKNLSERRARSTRNYLIAKGINAKRLTAKGYGETQLTNNCGNGQNCTESQHDLNRRSEFIVIKQ